MSADKSIAETGYTVFAAENGGVIVEGKGVNSCKNFAFSNAGEFLEFLCHQYAGVGAQKKIEEEKAEPGLTDGAALADNLTYSSPETLCKEYSARLKADEFFLKSMRDSIGCKGPKPVFELIHSSTGNVWKIYEDGRTEGFPEGGFIINRINILQHVAFAEGYDAGMKWNTE